MKLFIFILAGLLAAAIFEVNGQADGDVKLINGPTNYQGTVAVYHNNAWGTMCDDSWEKVDADVVCRQLGFEEAEQVWYRAYYGPGPGNIWVDQISCPSGVNSITKCYPEMEKWGEHDCSHSEDAGVDCKRKNPTVVVNSLPIRLSCPEYQQLGSCQNCSDKPHAAEGECSQQAAVEGVVTVFHEGKWYPINGQGFGIEEARVVCGELGFPLALSNPSLEELWTNHNGEYCSGQGPGSGMAICTTREIFENDEYRNKLGQVLLKDLDCVGGERQLNDCYFSEFGPNPNSGLNVATIRCGFKPHQLCTSVPPPNEVSYYNYTNIRMAIT